MSNAPPLPRLIAVAAVGFLVAQSGQSSGEDHVPAEYRKASPYIACGVDMSWKYANSKQAIEGIVAQSKMECAKFLTPNIENSVREVLSDPSARSKFKTERDKQILRSAMKMRLEEGFQKFVSDQISGIRKHNSGSNNAHN